MYSPNASILFLITMWFAVPFSSAAGIDQNSVTDDQIRQWIQQLGAASSRNSCGVSLRRRGHDCGDFWSRAALSPLTTTHVRLQLTRQPVRGDSADVTWQWLWRWKLWIALSALDLVYNTVTVYDTVWLCCCDHARQWQLQISEVIVRIRSSKDGHQRRNKYHTASCMVNYQIKCTQLVRIGCQSYRMFQCFQVLFSIFEFFRKETCEVKTVDDYCTDVND